MEEQRYTETILRHSCRIKIWSIVKFNTLFFLLNIGFIYILFTKELLIPNHMNYRRVFIPGASYFFTLMLQNRQSDLLGRDPTYTFKKFIAGFSLIETLVSLMIVTSITLQLLQQQWHIKRLSYKVKHSIRHSTFCNNNIETSIYNHKQPQENFQDCLKYRLTKYKS